MAAPSGIIWGTTQNSYARIGIYTKVSSSNTATDLTVEVWYWSKWSTSDTYNTFYFDNRSSSGSATTSRGALTVTTTVDTGAGWSTSNQIKLATYTYSYDRGTSDATRYLYAKLSDIDVARSPMTVSTTVKIPKLASYTISYNANGGSGAPSSQTKWYGTDIALSSTKPTRSGYSFSGWATSSGGSVAYAAGATYKGNANVTLYAVWKANTYKVSYNANGGSGAPSAQTKTHGVSLTLSTTKPTRTNYNFRGWGTSASATTVSYAAGATYTSNAAITLYAIWELAYTKPRITNLSVTRCNVDGVASDEGTYAAVKFTWECDKTISSIVIEALNGSQVFVSKTVPTTSTSGTGTTVIGDGVLSIETSYTIRVIVTDSNGYTRKSKTLSGMRFPIDFKKGGKGVSFGKPSTLDSYVDYGMNAVFDNYLSIYGRDLDGNIKLAFQPQNENGNTVVGWDNYSKGNGSTNIYGYDVNIGVSNTANPGTYRPYYRRGDSVTFSGGSAVKIAGYVTNSGKDVTFTVPLALPILGSPTATATSVSGFVLRQGDKYTHGSGASSYVTPDSYSVTYGKYGGLRIVAQFSNVTNVTNNDAIGIFWSGTVTFT